MKPKHTPGPWRYEYDGGQIWHDTSDDDNELICEGVSSENTRLIAAAPEMFEALEMLAQDFDYPPAAYELIQSAIRKARGE